jgi:transcriptional regulator with XRE-family HTH domain
MNEKLGKKIKEIRTSKGLKLKDLSEKTNLSIGFLSLIERGLTSAGLASLQSIADALEVDIAYFLNAWGKNRKKRILRSYEHEAFRIDDSKFVYFSLAGDFENQILDPVLVLLLPGESREKVLPFQHQGEEFTYVLEGILTFLIEDKEYEMNPGDSIHIPSTVPHNWVNLTSKLVRALYVVSPKIL